MTATTRARVDGQRPVYGRDGTPVASVNPSRSSLLGALLAECDRGHIFVVDDDMTGCPVCDRTEGQP